MDDVDPTAWPALFAPPLDVVEKGKEWCDAGVAGHEEQIGIVIRVEQE